MDWPRHSAGVKADAEWTREVNTAAPSTENLMVIFASERQRISPVVIFLFPIKEEGWPGDSKQKLSSEQTK